MLYSSLFLDCSTKKFLWAYSARSEEEFVLFCDLSELQKSHLHHRNQISPTQGSEHLPCSGSKDLSDVQWYLQLQNGEPLVEVTENHPHIIQDKNTLRFLTTGMNNAGSYICRPRIRYVPNTLLYENIPKSFIIWIYYLCSQDLVNSSRSPQDEACCVKTVLDVKPKTNASCTSPVRSHKQCLLLGSISSIYCPSLGCQSDSRSPEVTWYQVRTTSLKLVFLWERLRRCFIEMWVCKCDA